MMENKMKDLVRVAKMYYKDDKTQTQIAKQMYVSRSKISRMIQEAKERGIVEIKIHDTNERNYEIENELKEIFDLKDVRVLYGYNVSSDHMLTSLGALTSEYIDPLLTEGTTVGITRGNTMKSFVDGIAPSRKIAINVVQLIGAKKGNNQGIEGPELARFFANAYGGNYYYLFTPFYFEDESAKKLLMSTPVVADTLKRAENADIIISGIGSINENEITSMWDEFVSLEDVAKLREIGAVGHIFGYIFDINGKLIDSKLNESIVGVDIEKLIDKEYVIGVAGGEDKVNSILGALRGRLINVLIVDEKTALNIIAANKYNN